MDMNRPMQRALLSVSDKTGIVEFAKALHNRQIELISTGGTAELLRQHGLEVKDISSLTGYPEMMDGRVKTLHPKVHGGILGRRGTDDSAMLEHQIQPIDLVVVNLYPFAHTIHQPGCTLSDAIENIDIGGPTLIRSAAKNHRDVTVVVAPTDYQQIIDELEHNDALSHATRFTLAQRAFAHTAAYDSMIAQYLAEQNDESLFPQSFNPLFEKTMDLRYGENSHQQAAFYRNNSNQTGTLASSRQLQGKELSYNNIADADAALACVSEFEQTACVIVKHANPCGAAVGKSLCEAYQKAFASDPTSAFGGIIACNRELDATTAQTILASQFSEVVIAPQITREAAQLFAQKPNLRLLECGHLTASATPNLEIKQVRGGILLQQSDSKVTPADEFTIVSQRQPTQQQLTDLIFSWKLVKYVKSNAIVYAKDGQVLGVGAGQMSRVFSATIASMKAAQEKLELKEAVMASDAFFPFRDGIDAAAAAGIHCVIQPGGSMRDAEVIAAANEHDMVMIFTGIRHFRH